MRLQDFLKDPGNEHKREGNRSAKCNALSKTGKSFNCQLTPDQATDLAQFLLQKAQLLRRNKIEDGTVQLWNVNENSETVSAGLIAARKGPRRKARKRSAK
jgi:hypothetical protein